MSDGMEEIIDDFITEADESLEKIDPLFVELEEKGYDSELMNGIFRSVHTIKGAAGFLGFQDIVDVSHKTESLLKKLRDGEMSVSSGLITLILKSVDMLKALLQIIKTKDARPVDMDSLLGELDSALVDFSPDSASKEPPAAEPAMQQVADLAVEETAHECQLSLGDVDQTEGSVLGEVLDDTERLQPSALDPELVGEVLKVMRDLAEEGRTMIVVTHEMGFAREVSSEAIFLHDGRIEEQAPPAELFGNPKSERCRQFLASSL